MLYNVVPTTNVWQHTGSTLNFHGSMYLPATYLLLLLLLLYLLLLFIHILLFLLLFLLFYACCTCPFHDSLSYSHSPILSLQYPSPSHSIHSSFPSSQIQNSVIFI
uniref:Uncharacterized protein n=1 Tax=Cacopsylla melanoneura TaxID=428564 RepID=A0A8D8XJR2_9HEMI